MGGSFFFCLLKGEIQDIDIDGMEGVIWQIVLM